MSNPINQSMPLFALSGATSSPAAQTNLKNRFWRGVKVIVDITAITAGSLTVTIRGKDLVSGKTWTLLASAALTTTGTTILTVYPSLTASANAVANDALPETWEVGAAVVTGPITATITAQGLV